METYRNQHSELLPAQEFATSAFTLSSLSCFKPSVADRAPSGTWDTEGRRQVARLCLFAKKTTAAVATGGPFGRIFDQNSDRGC